MTRLPRIIVPLLGLLILSASIGQPAPSTQDVQPVPKTPVKQMLHNYHGTSVTDPYQWLEQGADLAVRDWTDQQTRYARTLLDQYPGLPALRAQIKRIVTAVSTAYNGVQYRGGKLFAL